MPGKESDAEESGAVPPWPFSWLRPKGNLTSAELTILLTLAALPLVAIVVRVLSLPDVVPPALSNSWLTAIGNGLNNTLSLEDIPSGDRDSVLYMLFLPTSALLIALARLTFGIRVIGFRAILISVGFQESGIVPSLILIGVVVTIVVGVRPALRRIRLPQVARLSVVMSIAVMVLIGALLIAPWTQSDVLWSVAFFPVIVLGLLAEGIAKTLDNNSGLVAVWRTFMTIGIALLIAGFSQIPVLREIVIQFPELVITQAVLIILIAEYLDLRLFQDWDAQLSGLAVPRLFGGGDRLRVAIVRNQRNNGVIARMGRANRSGYRRSTIRRIASILNNSGHSVERFEGDMSLLSKLREFLPPHPRTGEPGGIVLNLASGIQGTLPSSHVPAMLEMAGIAYAGASPSGQFRSGDPIVAMQILRSEGLSTPDLRVVREVGAQIQGLTYPMVVKDRYGSTSRLRVVRDREGLDDAIRKMIRRDGREALVEQFIPGRLIEVALLGNDPVECLPLVEVHPENDELSSPALLAPEAADEIREAARRSYRAFECRDAARVRVRLTRSGSIYVISVDSLGGLEEGGTFETAAKASGLSYSDLIRRVVSVAVERYRPGGSSAVLSVVPGPTDEEAGLGKTSLAGF